MNTEPSQANKRKLALENSHRKRSNHSHFSPTIQIPVKPPSPPFKYPSPVKTPEEFKTYSPVKTPPQSPLRTIAPPAVIPPQSFLMIGASLARLERLEAATAIVMSQKRKSYTMDNLKPAQKKIKF